MSLDKLFTRLLGTRDSLKTVCEELNIPLADEVTLKCLQCTQCSIWANKRQFIIEAGLPVCSFCQDMELLRF